MEILTGAVPAIALFSTLNADDACLESILDDVAAFTRTIKDSFGNANDDCLMSILDCATTFMEAIVNSIATASNRSLISGFGSATILDTTHCRILCLGHWWCSNALLLRWLMSINLQMLFMLLPPLHLKIPPLSLILHPLPWLMSINLQMLQTLPLLQKLLPPLHMRIQPMGLFMFLHFVQVLLQRPKLINCAFFHSCFHPLNWCCCTAKRCFKCCCHHSTWRSLPWASFCIRCHGWCPSICRCFKHCLCFKSCCHVSTWGYNPWASLCFCTLSRCYRNAQNWSTVPFSTAVSTLWTGAAALPKDASNAAATTPLEDPSPEPHFASTAMADVHQFADASNTASASKAAATSPHEDTTHGPLYASALCPGATTTPKIDQLCLFPQLFPPFELVLLHCQKMLQMLLPPLHLKIPPLSLILHQTLLMPPLGPYSAMVATTATDDGTAEDIWLDDDSSITKVSSRYPFFSWSWLLPPK